MRICVIVALEMVMLASAFAAGNNKPNIVLLLIDDWAWYGSPIPMDESMSNSKMALGKMPNLEKMAAEGMKFRNAYAAAPQCAPARVSIQTGKSTARSGFTLYLGKVKDDYYDTRKNYAKLPVVPNVSDTSIDADAVTIPEALKPLGYTSAHIGKWHMGGHPDDEGYAVNDGNTDNKPGSTLPRKERFLPEDHKDPKLMFSVTDKSIRFMREQVAAKKPFYLQVSHYAMHNFPECLPSTCAKYANLPEVKKFNNGKKKIPYKKDPAVWLGMLEDLDGRIGAVLDEIKTLGIEDNTYVVVVSDNGYRHTFFPNEKQPFHGHKWWIWQAGLRVPMIVKGPGIPANSAFDANVIQYDFLPTFVDWAGGNPKSLKDIDGVSLADYMRGKEPTKDFRNRNLYFHMPHYRETLPSSAIVSGTRKVMHFYERPDIAMLFDLAADEGEVGNIAKQNPEQHKKLHSQMMAYLKQVGGRFPKVNPNPDPAALRSLKQYKLIGSWGPFEGKRKLDEDEK